VFRRRIRLAAPAPGVVLGALEDDVHHVRVTLSHDGSRVTDCVGTPVRLPWVTCPASAAGLASVVGSDLTASLPELRGRYDRHLHCTHMFDVVHLAIAHAAARQPDLSYEAVVSDPDEDGVVAASLRRDGHEVLAWRVRGGAILEPAQFAGVELERGFVGWADANLGGWLAHEAFILRRAAWMSPIRHQVLDDHAVVVESGLPPGVCFTAQPERITIAARNVGSQRNYSRNSAGMLEGFDDAGQRLQE
jgi:hypothetical protein